MEFNLVGKTIPEWQLLPIFNEKVPTVKDFRGKPLLILFFYLGCPGCKGRAIPYANRIIYEDLGVNVIGIHTRFAGKVYTDEQLQAIKEEFHMRFPYYRDKPEATTFNTYFAGGTPHWVLVNSEGTVVQSMFGSDPNNALLRLDLKIKELLQSHETKEG
ncbi:AhpC/TSA family protein [Zhouia amylolytica]|uniref:AhpC/TSA family protein n=1 Tax=Zhouia amylolytica TaxID=376730 RepID=A0A1I6S9I4_9FLAO|nr:TlpA disulfide reductase family protein [Zhouia amylolytica]MCQ0110954.1 TlpA family protein disulfide reductase [Zhouia amylolytica]SFS73606.1 AhpC/TSA family protein [Zhouia amylolytica]